jgi:hypothetical protein
MPSDAQVNFGLSRRSLLRLLSGGICATAVLSSPRVAAAYPEFQNWQEFDGATPSLGDNFAKLIMITNNPYCKAGGTGSDTCGTDPTNWPKRIVPEPMFRRHVETNFREVKWNFPEGTDVPIFPSLRVPYVVKEAGTAEKELVLEHILFGLGPEAAFADSTTDLGKPAFDLGLFLRFTLNSLFKPHAVKYNELRRPSTDPEAGPTVGKAIWPFRGITRTVEVTYRAPLIWKKGGAFVKRDLYWGYEGGGAY